MADRPTTRGGADRGGSQLEPSRSSAPAPAPAGRLGRSSRILILAAALALLAGFVLPLWHIGLRAPQYPEGLGMYIWVDRITGEKPHELNSINGLNHYIGMKPIVPESIPELRFMPVALAILAGAGVLVAVLGRRRVLHGWIALFLAGTLAGLADFWWWGYDYGHNLDPTAAIRIPGMSYQPPLLGTKQLLNFEAASWPAAGGWIILAALLLALIVAVRERRRAPARVR